MYRLLVFWFMYFCYHIMATKIRRFLWFAMLVGAAWGQCAMCRKNAEQANPGLVQGLRVGILVLLAAPYVAAGVVGWLWYRRNFLRKDVEASSRDGG